MTIDMMHLCAVDVELGRPMRIGSAGQLIVAPIDRLTLTGERLSGTSVGPAADWLSVVDGVGYIDVRATIETHDGHLVYVQYQGRSDASGGFGSAPLFVAPRFEAGDGPYRWLNSVQAVGRGSLSERHYEWYELR